MKRTIAILLAAVLLTALLCGCGEMTTPPPTVSATPIPEVTPIPESMMPKPEDGVVNDGDGIIEPSDNGTGNVTDNTSNPARSSTANSAAKR